MGYENGKYESMMNDNNNDNALVVAVDDNYTHYISIYEFIYGEQNLDANEQCFDYLEPFELCLLINDDNERIVWIENEENNKQNSFNFEQDSDWNEINQIIEGDNEQ